jgi:hypothetical protein
MRLVVLLIIAYVHITTQFELVGENVEESDLFGFSVAIWGNTVAVVHQAILLHVPQSKKSVKLMNLDSQSAYQKIPL